MVTYRFSAADLADLRFAYSPLLETITSLWALRWPQRYAEHLPWIKQARAALAGADGKQVAQLHALLGAERGWLPDFLSPHPTGLPDIDTDLAAVAATPPARVRSDFRAVYGSHPLPELPPAAAVAEILRWYWQLAIEPHWPRMRAVLEADMQYRAHKLTHEGVGATLADLDPRARWSGGRLRLYTGATLEFDVPVAGRGFWLMPTVFVPQTISPVGPHEPPAIAYPARGIGTLWLTAPAQPRAALAELIGTPRARLLVTLHAPTSTTDLAIRLGVTPSAVSQHLAVLRRTGLVSSTRAGRSVLHKRSALGDALAHSHDTQ